METRKIKIQNNWYTFGDIVSIKEVHKFLFWKWTTSENWQIRFIGNDSCAQIYKGGITKTIVGSVEIS